MPKWWQERVVYQIYPRSFQDTNGDGIGDLPGIISRLDYLRELGVGVIWLSPIYPSPNVDFGYDVSDYKAIHPDFGTMEDFDRLVAEAEKRDIKIILDLVINHTSDQHPWFQQSRDPHSPYRDYYIWRRGRGGRPPNNWTGFFGGRTWSYDEQSGQYYLHLFSRHQPDLNYHNPRVLEEVKEIMRFWLDKGAAGFRCDVINVLYKTSLENGCPRLILRGREHYLSQPGNLEILQELRHVLEDYDAFTVGETVFITPKEARELCDQQKGGLNSVFSFEHMETDQFVVKWFKRKFVPSSLARVLAKWQAAVPWNANYFENHDQPRSVSRFGDDGYWDKSAKLLCVMLFTLRGTPFVYQGQEIGMTNFDFAGMEEIKDVESHNIYAIARRLGFPRGLSWKLIKATSRDNARTPMQWTSGANGGFSTAAPWLGVNANHAEINAAAQRRDPNSVLGMYKKMIALRQFSDTLLLGSFEPVDIKRRFFSYRRRLDDEVLLVLLNFSAKPTQAYHTGALILSNYLERKTFDGLLKPYEAVILREV